MDDISSWVLAGFTGALVLVTLIYAYFTRKLAKFQSDLLQFEKNKYETTREPSLFFFPFLTGEGFQLEVCNIGKSPCKRARIDISFEHWPKDKGAEIWAMEAILPGHCYRYKRLFKYDEVCGLGKMKVESTFTGAFSDEQLSSRQEIDTSQFKKVQADTELALSDSYEP